MFLFWKFQSEVKWGWKWECRNRCYCLLCLWISGSLGSVCFSFPAACIRLPPVGRISVPHNEGFVLFSFDSGGKGDKRSLALSKEDLQKNCTRTIPTEEISRTHGTSKILQTEKKRTRNGVRRKKQACERK